MNVGQVEFAVIADGLDTVLGKVTELEGTLNGMNGKRYNIGKGVASDMRAVQRQMEHTLVNFGSRMQTLGRTLQNVTMPFNNIIRGFTMGIGYRALNKVLDGLTGAFQRADILNTAEARITELGLGKDLGRKFTVGTNKAATAMENLDQAVQGLPTGLDEIVASMQVYVGASEDVEKSTRMAIAANNAYIASGVDATRKRFAERQLQNLMSGTELTSQQWDSLRKNIPLALNATAHKMKMTTGEMIDGLKNGRIEAEKFIDAFIKVGTEGKVAKSAQIMKQTWEALSSNISIAFSRMGANILDTMNEVTKKTTGRTFLQHLLGVDKNGKDMGDGIKGIINGISESAQDWIKANPDKIIGFLDTLKNFDWKGLVGEIGSFVRMVGEFYGGIIKFMGGKNFARLMLWGNAFGKVLTIVGGITRGLAGPISKLLTGTGLFGVAKAITGFGAVTDAMSSISWQGVASKAISVAAIPAMAWALKEVALGLQELDKVNLSWGLVGKIAVAGGAITAFAGLAATMGALTTGHLVGWITTAGTAVGMAEMAGIAKTMKWVGEGLNAIADAKLPPASKIKSVMQTMNQIDEYFKPKNPLTSIAKMFDSWTKSSEFKAVKHMSEALDSAYKMLQVPTKKGWQTHVIKRMRHLFDVADAFEAEIERENEELEGKSESPQAFTKGSKAKKMTKSYTYRKQRLAEFAEYAKSFSAGLSDIVSALTSINKFNTKWEKIKGKSKDNKIDWGSINGRISKLINSFYQLSIDQDGKGSPLQKLREAAKQVEGTDYTKMTEAFNELPKIIGKLSNLQAKIESNQALFKEGRYGSGLTNLSLKLNPLFTAISDISAKIPKLGGLKRMGKISSALDRVKTVIGKLKELSGNTDVGGISITSINEAASKIKEALAAFDDIKEKNVEISLKIDEVKGGDEVVKAVKDEIDRVKKKIEGLDGNIDKKIYAHLSSGAVTGGWDLYYKVKSKIDEIRRKIMGLGGDLGEVGISAGVGSGAGGGGGGGWAGGHPDRHNGGKIHPLYRAHGGSIFMSRGTDTVPTMLTPGEFVINRMAASRIGDAALWKLNHMDIAGALRSLSAKAGQSIVPRGNVVNNTTNNTRNATVNLNNYNNGSMGIARASRWAKSL